MTARKKRPTAKEARALANEAKRREETNQTGRDLQRALNMLPDSTERSRAFNAAIDAAREVLTRFHYLKDALKEAEEKIEELDGKVTTLENKLFDHEYAIADAAYAVCELAPKVLGHESCHVDEALPVYELRRAIEDLQEAIP